MLLDRKTRELFEKGLVVLEVDCGFTYKVIDGVMHYNDYGLISDGWDLSCYNGSKFNEFYRDNYLIRVWHVSKSTRYVE